jgi:hypothetical protein
MLYYRGSMPGERTAAWGVLPVVALIRASFMVLGGALYLADHGVPSHEPAATAGVGLRQSVRDPRDPPPIARHSIATVAAHRPVMLRVFRT